MNEETVSLEYPKAKYHATEPVRVAHNAEEDEALGSEWVDSPNDIIQLATPILVPKRRGRPPKVKV